MLRSPLFCLSEIFAKIVFEQVEFHYEFGLINVIDAVIYSKYWKWGDLRLSGSIIRKSSFIFTKERRH